ncbi:MAG TPA: protein kinase [Verrucomicrobiae bacterium]
MKTCDSCGGPLSDGFPFITCGRCLFGGVLGPDTIVEDPIQVTPDQPASRLCTAGLFPRRDFWEKFDIIEKVDSGGQGAVWRVWDFEFRRVVAMKRLDVKALRSPSAVYRFLAEAQITSQLQHPGILPVFDIGLDPDGQPFYTTQFLSGETFAKIWHEARETQGSRVAINRALELMLRVCDVMAHAHSRGVIHRDLKPANILTGPFGDVRVIDWGSAFVLGTDGAGVEEPFVPINQPPIQTGREEAMHDDPDSPLSTKISGLPTTVLFTAPELLSGQMGQLGPQTDVYSLGVMLYELLSGRPPYTDEAGNIPPVDQLKEWIKDGVLKPVRKVNPKASRDLAAICEKAMAKKKFERYPTMLMLADDIRAALEIRPVQARRPGLVLRSQRFAQRHAGYVLLVCLIAVLVAVGFSVSGRLRRQRDVALQVQALRDGELAARNGHWREALRHWDEAEAAGYNDTITLGLQRAEAWTVLNQPDRSGGELRKLMNRSDLGPLRGSVFLNMGDFELFDKATAPVGEAHIRESEAAGLGHADQLVAEGLLAESAPKALACFQQALQLDPYSYTAHIHSLGMEFVLGHHSELVNHIRVFSILYPDDPSPHYLAATESALSGHLSEATAALEPLRQSMSESSWNKLALGYRKVSEAAQCFNIDQYLTGDTFDSQKLYRLMNEAGALITASLPQTGGEAAQLREPNLPCLEHGFLDGVAAVQALGLPFYKDIASAVAQVKSCWLLCPEASLPFRAAAMLEARQPTVGEKSISLLSIQAELFQMAADSSSFLSDVPRTARYLATRAEFELIPRRPTNANAVRSDCLRNIQTASVSQATSPAECGAYFTIACKLGDYDSARQLLDRWERALPTEPEVRRHRIELDLMVGSFGAATQLIDRLLATDPNDSWLLDQRRIVADKLKGLLDSLDHRLATPGVTNKSTL